MYNIYTQLFKSGNNCDALTIIFMTTKFCPLHVHCYLFTLQQSSVHTMFLVAGLKISKPVNRAFFTGSEPVKIKRCEMGVCLLPGSCMHVAISRPPPPHPNKKIQCWSLISAPARASEQHWSIHLLSEGRGHRRISILWVRKYKTYFVQDCIATYAILKIITEGIFSWKAWLNETINTFSSHMKLDKINCILIDDGLLNLKDLEILTSVVSDFK